MINFKNKAPPPYDWQNGMAGRIMGGGPTGDALSTQIMDKIFPVILKAARISGRLLEN